MSIENQPPVILLAGPPGVGKTALGRAVCEELGLRFVDLAEHADQDVDRQKIALEEVLAARAADVVELPWELQLQRGVFKLCRRVGRLIALWAHPLDMQERSGRSEPLFTPPQGRATTRGGFGLRGTSCPEFRRIDRACQTTLMLVGLSLDEARQQLCEALAGLIRPPSGSVTEREGLADWAEDWQQEYNADPQAAQMLVEAMARFIRHLKQQGASPRSLGGVYSDLHALGTLNFAYDRPKGERVLDQLGAWQYEFSHKFACSESESRRYRRTYEQFCKFLGKREPK